MESYTNEFQFLDGVYEFRSDRPAIELLVGDPKLLDFIKGKDSIDSIKEYLFLEEEKWKSKILKYQYD